MGFGKEQVLGKVDDSIDINRKTPLQLLIKMMAIIMSLYHLFSIVIGRTEPYFYRFTHLMLALILGYLLLVLKKDGFGKVYSISLAIFTLLLYIYFYLNYERLVVLIPGMHMLTFWDKAMGVLLIFLILEGTRRYIGLSLFIISILFLIYIFVSPYLSGLLYQRGLSFNYVIHYLVYSFGGVFGSPIAVSSSYIVLFLIFGSILSISGVGEYFIKLATALAGGARGGPAKVAVLSSALIGTIIGSPSANVVITGTFTIPMMKREGFKPDFAAGVEAAASTGGTILPPIMGSVAFVMADMLGIQYVQVAKASFIPALIYFLSILFMVDFYAIKNNIHGLPKHIRPTISDTLKHSYKLAPLFVIIIMLIKGFSPIFAGLFGIISSLFIGIIDKNNRPYFIKILEALEKASTTAVQIIIACAVSGLIMGVISLTGLNGKLTSLILELSGGKEMLILFFLMIITIILGMGLVITPVYIMAAALGAPALISCGFTPVATHLFILYFATLAPLTPPLAITAYVASNIAGGNFGKTALNALFLASSGFVIPYIFIYHNELLMIGKSYDIFIAAITAIMGIIFFAGGIQGFIIKRLNIFQRVIIIIASLLVIVPGLFTGFIGILIIGVVLLFLREDKIDKNIYS